MEALSLQDQQRTITTATRMLSQHKTTCTIKALPGKHWPEKDFQLSAVCYIDDTKQFLVLGFCLFYHTSECDHPRTFLLG